MINPNFSLLLPEQWDYDILEDGRIVYFKRSKSEDSTVPFQWIPPLDTWKQLNNLVSQEPSVMYLPYGIEMAYDATGNLYYLSHITMQTLRDLPEGGKVETRDIISKKLKEVNISRHPLVGYGFMLSSNPPLFVSHVVPGGPADGKLTQGDLLYTIHGHDISIQVSTDDVLGAIDTPLDPHVLQIAVVPKPKPRNKRPPPPPPTHKAKVRFNTPLFEVMSEDDGSFIRIRAATGSEHVLRVNTGLTFVKIIAVLKVKLHLNCPVDTLGIVATRQSNRITLPPALLVTDSVLRSSDGWIFHLRIRILPLDLDGLLVRCPSSLSYLYFQTCQDLFCGYFIADVSTLTQLLAIRIWFECVRSHSGKSKPKKPTYKSMRRLGGFEVFLPKIWIDRASLQSKKDLFKQVISEISRSKYPSQESLIKLLFLKKSHQHISAFGGALFHAQVQVLDKVTRICVLPSKGVAEEKVLTDIKSAPVYSSILNLCDLIEVHVTEFSRRDDLSKVRLTCVNGKELIFIMRLYDGCELGEVLQSYYSQRVKPVLILNDSISHSISTFSSKKSGNLKDAVPSPKVDHLLSSTNPIRTNFPLPSYQSTHLVVPQIWSYILVSPTQPNALHQFSPLNFPLKFSGRIRVSSSNSRGSGTLIPELLLDQCQQLLSGSPSETYFTDSFDEVTDSESEEYNLEVPTQFVKESLKKIHHIQSDVPHDDTDKFWDRENDPLSCVNSNTPAINVDFNSGNPEETQNSLVFPNSPTGIPPPPLFKSPQISFERLTNLLNTPPSPICSDNGAESLSTFSSVIIPRSTNDSSLRARSDTLLSTHSCHSKYDHRYSREHNLASPSNDEFSKRKLYITTHVDDQPVHSKFDEFTKAFDPFEKYHISSDLFELDSALSNNDEKIEEYSVTSLAPTTDIDAQIRISPCIPTPSDEFNSEPSSEEDIIVLRPPPPIPTAVRFNELDNNADLINDQIEFSNISVFSRTNPLPTGSVPLQQIFQEEIVVPVSEPIPYQPVARKRNRTSKFNNYSEHSIIPEAPPRAEVSSFSTNEILQRPPSMFAERYSYPGLSIEINEVQECNESKIEEVPPTSYDHDRLNSIDLEKGTNFLLFDANKSKNSNNAITSEAQSQIENVQVADDVKLQLSLHESIFSQFDPVRIFTDSDPNLNQFQNLIPASIPHSNVVIGLPFTIDRTLESQLDHSEATDEHLDSNSICDHFQVVSNETKTRLSEADCTNEVLHQDSGLETSIESTNLPPDITDSSTFTQDDDEQLSKQSVSICDGSIEIRSARSIELFDCYPDYELPNRPSPPYYSLQTIPFNSRCNDIFEKKDLSPPPLPMSAPPELEDTD